MSDKWIRLDSDNISDCAPLWRYMDLPKFLWLLEHKQLYFPSIPILWPNDSYEGFKTPRSTERVIEKELGTPQYAANKQEREQQLKDLAPYTYVSCWNRSDDLTRAMWNDYAGPEGVAIETTVGRLLGNLDTPQADSLDILPPAVHLASPIIYLDFDREDDEQGIKDGKKHLEASHMLKARLVRLSSDPSDPKYRPFVEASTLPYRRKQQKFDPEKEYRLFIMTFPRKPEQGLALPISLLQRLIKKVHISPYGKNPGSLKEDVRSHLDAHGLEKIPVCLRQDCGRIG